MATVERRAAHIQGIARRNGRDDPAVALFDEGHQFVSSGSGSASPSTSCAFVCRAMIAVATCSLRCNTASAFVAAASCRSFDPNFGLRPRCRGSSPGAPSVPSCCRPAGLHQPQLLRRGEPPTGLGGHALYRGSVHAATTLCALGLDGPFTIKNWGCFRHVGLAILRPSVQRYPEGPVSRDVGTGGCAAAPADTSCSGVGVALRAQAVETMLATTSNVTTSDLPT